MNEPLHTALPLENGLTLEILDRSRTLAGDRWLVHLTGRIRIPLEDGLLDDPRALDRLKQAHGDVLEYRTDLKRHFVKPDDKERILQAFEHILLTEKGPYLKHPDFARRYALKCLGDLERGREWKGW